MKDSSSVYLERLRKISASKHDKIFHIQMHKFIEHASLLQSQGFCDRHFCLNMLSFCKYHMGLHRSDTRAYEAADVSRVALEWNFPDFKSYVAVKSIDQSNLIQPRITLVPSIPIQDETVVDQSGVPSSTNSSCTNVPEVWLQVDSSRSRNQEHNL